MFRARHEGVRLPGGRYELRAKLHQGPMSRVYTAYDRTAGEIVIVKMVIEDPRQGDLLPRAYREALALSRLRHPRIVRLLDTGCLDQGYYLVEEYVYGTSLDALMDEMDRLPMRMAVAAVGQTLEGLSEVHRIGLVHRDIKPGNLILGAKGIKIIDFGLATLHAAACGRAKRLTQPMHTVGTPDYIAPEQCLGTSDPDPRIDLYACGVLLYEMLTGTHPFHAHRTGPDLLKAHCQLPPRPFSEAAPKLGLPGALEAVAMKALAKDPKGRYRDAEEMREALYAAAIA